MEIESAFFALLVAALGVLSALVVLPFLSYVLAAVLLAFVLYPVQRRCSEHVDDRVSAFLLVAGAGALAVLPLWLAFQAVLSNLVALSEDPDAFRTVGALDERIDRVLGMDVPLQQVVAAVPGRAADALTAWGPTAAGAGVHIGVGLLLLVFLLYYLLKDGATLVDWTNTVTPLPNEVQRELYAEIHSTTWAVLKGHVFVAIAQGLAAGVGLYLTGVPNAGFWTLVMVLLGFLPVVGIPAVWIPAAIYLALVGRPFAAGLLALYGLTLVGVIDDYLRAYLVDRDSSLHAGTILVGVFGAVYVFGAMGLFVGPVVLGLFKSIVEVANRHYDVGLE